MGVVAVYAAVRHQSEHMKGRIMFFAVFNCCEELRNLEKVPVLNGFCDSGQFLVYDTACSHVQMTYLRVAHLSLGKSHCHAASLALYKGALAHELVHNRSLALAYSVVLAVIVQSVAV